MPARGSWTPLLALFLVVGCGGDAEVEPSAARERAAPPPRASGEAQALVRPDPVGVPPSDPEEHEAEIEDRDEPTPEPPQDSVREALKGLPKRSPSSRGDYEEIDGIDADTYRGLESGYPEERIEAVEDLDSDGAGLRRLIRITADDPAPEVRAAAVEQLGYADSHAATNATLDALQDPAPEVILAAIEVLELNGDETLIPELTPLLLHRDKSVRSAAAEAIELLE